jgi:hypothetical protein
MMTILFRPQGAFGWFDYTTSRDTIAITARTEALPLSFKRLSAEAATGSKLTNTMEHS